MLPREKPCRTVQTVCAYWLMSSDESNAEARGQTTANRVAAPSTRSAIALPIDVCALVGIGKHKSAHILTADQRDVLAELLLVQLDQPATMPDLFLAHLFKNLCGTGKVFLQVLAVVGVNAFVFFLQRNSEGKDLLFGQAIEVSQC